MPTTGIETAIRELERDVERINQAIRLLKSVNAQKFAAAPAKAVRKKQGRRKLSAAGRRRIADAAKKRWANFRATGKK